MSNTIEGFIKKLFEKHGTGKKGAWTAYSLRIEDADGNEIDQWFSAGFNAPATADGTLVQEGDFVRFTATEDDRGYLQISDLKRKKNPPARQGTSSGGGGKGGNDAGPSIQYQNSRTAAITLVGVLLENDAIPVTAGKNKGDKVKRFDEALAYVDKLTVQFAIDLGVTAEHGFRLFETVADGRIVGSEADSLPADTAEELEAEGEADLADTPADSGDDFE